MTGDELPHDLAMLEKALRSGGQPSSSLRQRVMDRVQDDLQCSQQDTFWQYAAGVAASVLLILNFGISATSASRQTIDMMSSSDVTLLYEQISAMELGLSPDEIRRQCVLLAAGEKLLPLDMPRRPTSGISAILDQ